MKRALRFVAISLLATAGFSTLRAQTNPKEGVIRRRLEDGREFDIHERYFETSDILTLATEAGFQASIRYVGSAFLAATLCPSTSQLFTAS